MPLDLIEITSLPEFSQDELARRHMEWWKTALSLIFDVPRQLLDIEDSESPQSQLPNLPTGADRIPIFIGSPENSDRKSSNEIQD